MTPPISIGSQVIIIGPTEFGNMNRIGQKFNISMEHAESEAFGGRILFSAHGLPWYPASSLQLVEEELKIGDYAEVINPGVSNVGEIHKVIRIDASPYDGYPIQLDDFSWWGVASLRKLTPEEVSMYTSTLGYKMQECADEMEKAKEAVRDILAPLVDERLTAIEKRLDAQRDRADRQEDRQDNFSKRLRDVEYKISALEGEQPEVIDCDQIRIPKNAYISMRSDQNGKVAIDYSDGGFELAKAFLDSMEEA